MLTKIVISVMGALVFPVVVLADNGYCDGWWPMMGWTVGGGGIFMMIFGMFFWVLIIIGIIYLAKWIFEQNQPQKMDNHALEILKERYARGEINEEEFNRIKKNIS